jgi:hypothetical protein
MGLFLRSSRWLRPAATVLLLACSQAQAGADAATDTPPPVHVRKCVDMDGHAFDWQWSNVPFASICSTEAVADATSAPAQACSASCSGHFNACFGPAFDQARIDTCFGEYEACLAGCRKTP